MPSPRTTRRLAVLAAALLLVGCSGDGGEADDTASTADPDEVGELSPVPDALESLAEPPPGQGVAVLGIQELSFEVTDCHHGSEEGDTPEATLELRVEGEGEMSDGPFTVEITRYRSDTGQGQPVLTETAQVVVEGDDGPVGAEAKRSTSGPGGTWLDLRDPDATEPLIERQGDAVDVRGTFGPEGSVTGDDGLEQGRIRARCPA